MAKDPARTAPEVVARRAASRPTSTSSIGIPIPIPYPDFGTGYSSLSYLQSFAFDKIKIDRAFISDLPNNTQNASIVRAVAALGKSLQMTVVAEGVETSFQADMLEGLDCDELQGFLIARPMACSEINNFLAGYANSGLKSALVV